MRSEKCAEDNKESMDALPDDRLIVLVRIRGLEQDNNSNILAVERTVTEIK